MGFVGRQVDKTKFVDHQDTPQHLLFWFDTFLQLKVQVISTIIPGNLINKLSKKKKP